MLGFCRLRVRLAGFFWLLAARRGGRRWQDKTHDPAVPWEGVSSGHGHFSLVAPLEPSTRVDGTQADLED